MAKRKQLFQSTFDKLDSMEVGETFTRKEFILQTWGDYDYFINASFGQMFHRAKTKIYQSSKTQKYFRSIKNEIVRIN